ncbi:MAG: adenosylcobinamide-phosphate synthase CbiB [Thermodesulfobacteriota bacterium]
MNLELQICLAVLLDLIFGDPRWFPHPVKFMGRLAMALEAPARRAVRNPRAAGIMVATAVILATAAVALAVLEAARYAHPRVADAVSVVLIYTGIAARDLVDHSRAVWHALSEQNLEFARKKVGMICGRDTASLDEAGIARATVESVAENLVDGVTAPLFFAAVAGPVGMMVYKAVSTLDSTFGYKNERYIEFGWASARVDDVLAFIPARLTALCVPLGALLLRERPLGALRIFLRDRGKHPSPNAGQSEAAVAGALGVQLGGPSVYGGVTTHKPTLGDPVELLGGAHIRRANTLMLVTAGLVVAALLATRIVVGSIR